MRNLTIATGLAVAVAAMFALAPAKADTLKSDGKCWVNTNQTNFHWGDCPHESHHHHKG